MSLRSMVLFASIFLGSPAWSLPALSQIPPPEFSKSALLNGMEIFFLPATESRCQFLLMIQNGAAFDPIDKWGVTELTTRMMLERTTRRTGEQLRQDLARLGAELEVRVDWDAIYFSGSAPPERIEDALNVLSEIVVRPDFEEEDFERVRKAQVDSVQRAAGDPAVRTQQVFLQELFQQNPYAHPTEGTVETLKAILLNDVKIQYRRLFLPNQAQLALYYSGDQAPLFRGLARTWGSWIRGEAAPFTFRKAETPSRNLAVIVDTQDSSRGLLRLGMLSVTRSQPEFYEFEVLRHYLTLFLTDWARDLTDQSQIQATVRLDARRMPGFLQVSLQAPTPHLAAYALKFRDLMADLQQGKIDLNRFKEAKELAFLDLRRTLENPVSRLEQLMQVHLHSLGISYFTTYGIRLERVQESRLQQVLKDFSPVPSLLLVAAGDASILKPQLEAWGEVRVLN